MTGIEPALSAWELACHASLTRVFAAQRVFTWSVSARYRPSQTALPGTQRARPAVDHDRRNTVKGRLTLILRLYAAAAVSATVAHLGFGIPCHSHNRLESYAVAVNDGDQHPSSQLRRLLAGMRTCKSGVSVLFRQHCDSDARCADRWMRQFLVLPGQFPAVR